MAATHFSPQMDQPVEDETTLEQPLPQEPATEQSSAGRPPADSVVETGTPCQCGHYEGAHEHYRRGTDCALCACARYRKERRRRKRPGSD